ncbi:MFS transporter [Streptomyces sp. CA-250714]|uniref:MFS transporter n=1 Tax=Streptomyces sp. CA-250714 TaxID=3240060 RepID=UPI003D8E7586
MCAYTFLRDLVLLYPVYALLFAEHGLSPAEISSLFVIWSVTAFALEIPSGLWADLFSRRLLLVCAPLLSAMGFALWTFVPSYPAFAAGFVLWGADSALRSGTWQALTYEQLARCGQAEAYPALVGRAHAMGTSAALLADVLAAPVLAAAGYWAVGMASVAACVVTALTALTFPSRRTSQGTAAVPADGHPEPAPTLRTVAASALAQARGSPGVARAVVLTAVVTGVTALDEYVPLLAQATGAAPVMLPLLVGLVSAGAVAGGWLAGRGERWAAPVLAAGALLLTAASCAAAVRVPAGFLPLAAAFAAFYWAVAHTEARLQERVDDSARATVTSVAGFGSEVVAVAVYSGYAAGSAAGAGPAPLFACAAVPFLCAAYALRRGSARPTAMSESR